MSGSFIVIEGVDASGKKTQTDLLVRRLRNEGRETRAIDFPQYDDNAFGELVGRYLNGEFGELLDIPPYYAVLPYMIDQYLGGQKIKRWVDEGKTVVADRYFTSNVHQIAKYPAGPEREAFRDWLWPTGWDELGIYRPDLVIVLLVPPAVARRLGEKKGERAYLQEKLLDIAEQDHDHQTAAYHEYLYMVETEPTWVAVQCLHETGELRSPEAIQEDIQETVDEAGL